MISNRDAVYNRQSRGARTQSAYHQLLLDVSTFFHPDPAVSYRYIADRLSEFYGSATSAITLLQGEQIAFKYVANPPAWAEGLCGVPTEDAYCARTLRTNRVTLIQDVRQDAEFCSFQTVSLGWTRYLGAPIRDNLGRPIGTLCIIDGQHEDELGEADKELVLLLAMRVSTELERERLFEERLALERQALEERSRQLEFTQQSLNAISHALRNANLLLEESVLMLRLAEALMQISKVQGVAILQMSDTNTPLKGVVSAGQAPQWQFLSSELWREIGRRLTQSEEPFISLPDTLAHELGAKKGLACLYRNSQEPAGLIALGYTAPESDESFLKVYLEPSLRLTAQVLEGYYLRQNLQQMYEELQRMQQQLVLHEKLSVVGLLSVTTAHDIRNILSALSVSLSLNSLPEPTSSEVRYQLDRLQILAHRLLSFGRPQHWVFTPVHLPSLLQRVLNLTHSYASMAQVEIQVACAPRLPRIEGDVNQLEHALVNLVFNGIKAMESSGGVLRLSAHHKRNWVILRVSDTGPGIPTDILPRLFEPFTTSRHDGFGLGLFSVKQVVDKHGGHIKVHTSPQEGTTFEIHLPIRQCWQERSQHEMSTGR